jgi:hypothetical protein
MVKESLHKSHQGISSILKETKESCQLAGRRINRTCAEDHCQISAGKEQEEEILNSRLQKDNSRATSNLEYLHNPNLQDL